MNVELLGNTAKRGWTSVHKVRLKVQMSRAPCSHQGGSLHRLSRCFSLKPSRCATMERCVPKDCTIRCATLPKRLGKNFTAFIYHNKLLKNKQFYNFRRGCEVG